MTEETVYKVYDWYRNNARSLPWRMNKEPYRIWVSEIILQQTRVQQGIPYFIRFLATFPTIQHLAAAPVDEVLKLWEGLGYYSRAHNMMACAKEIVYSYGGVFPGEYQRLAALPGVGPYTAAAIASIAMGLPHAAVDGNVVRVLSRIHGITNPVDLGLIRRQIHGLAQEYMRTAHEKGLDPGDWNQAMMEFGAVQCTARQPRCDTCPLVDTCQASLASLVHEIPVKRTRTKVRERRLDYVLVRRNEKFGIRKRSEKDIWAGLWQLPLLPSSNAVEEPGSLTPVWKTQHRLSHQNLQIYFWKGNEWDLNDEDGNGSGALQWITASEKGNFAFPVPLLKFLEQAEVQGWI